MRRCLTVGVLLLLLSGCSTSWEHTSKRPSEFRLDDQECQLLTGGAYRSAEPGREQRLSYEDCMWQKGWRKTNVIWFFNPTPK